MCSPGPQYLAGQRSHARCVPQRQPRSKHDHTPAIIYRKTFAVRICEFRHIEHVARGDVQTVVLVSLGFRTKQVPTHSFVSHHVQSTKIVQTCARSVKAHRAQ